MIYKPTSDIFFKRHSECSASYGELIINHRKICTPILWISYEFYSPKGLWKYVKNIKGILVNVHNIEERKTLTRRLLEGLDFRSIIKFHGHIMLDCGGIKFAKGNKNFHLDNVLHLAKKVDPDIMISPDYPISPFNSLRENKLRIKRTLQNLVKASLFAKENSIPLMPVIHGYDLPYIDYMLKKVFKIINEINIIGIGSLVPLLVPFTIDKTKKVLDLILYLRKKLPNAFIHVFGMGSILTMHLAFLAGADSVDSQSWIRSAGYGKIQVPGNGQLFVRKNDKKYKFKQWSKEAPKNFDCDCPICLEKGKKSLAWSKKFRAIHNAYTLCSEAQIVSKMIKNGEYVDFIKQRLKNTVLFNLFKYVQSKTQM